MRGKTTNWLTGVFLRLPKAARERLTDNQAQKKGEVWHIVMGVKCIKLNLRTS